MIGPDPNPQKSLNPFYPRETPPGIDSPKNFKTQNPAGVSGGVGPGPWWLGMVPAAPWPRGKITRALTVGCPLCSPWRLRVAPESRRIILPGGRVGGAFQGAGAPGGEYWPEGGGRHPFQISQHLVLPVSPPPVLHLWPWPKAGTVHLGKSSPKSR